MSERLSCFVIMPYSESSDKVYQCAILPALSTAKAPSILALRADQMVRNVTLKAHVEQSVQSADFCLVDITHANPNVMYELGYAAAQKKPVIIIQEENALTTPANIREMLV